MQELGSSDAAVCVRRCCNSGQPEGCGQAAVQGLLGALPAMPSAAQDQAAEDSLQVHICQKGLISNENTRTWPEVVPPHKPYG